jgi:hypothetical protein
MIIDAMKDLTVISEREDDNIQNYMEGLNYIENLYTFMNSLKLVLPVESVTFLPSFKGKYISEKLGIASVDKENEMKIFRVQSSLFFEDKTVLRIKRQMSEICSEIEKRKDTITFYLP